MKSEEKELGEFTILAIVISGGVLGIILAVLSGVHHYSSVPTAALIVSSLIVGISVGVAKVWTNRWSQLVVFALSIVYGFIFAPMPF